MEKSDIMRQYRGRGIITPPINMQEWIFQIIDRDGPITRSEIVKETGIPRTTIYDIVVKLILNERVRQYSVPSGGRGRPQVFYEVTGVSE